MRNSPTKLLPQLKLSSSSSHIVVVVAENDSPEFRKQSEEFYQVSEHYFDQNNKRCIYPQCLVELSSKHQHYSSPVQFYVYYYGSRCYCCPAQLQETVGWTVYCNVINS